jgi:uncharacterized protein YdhG (YjbR/CyaY superfamily)
MIEANGIKFKTVDEYVAIFPASTQTLLETMRKTIREAAPEAEEIISYNMPAYKWQGVLVYFAAYKHHIGFYPTGSGIAAFTKEIAVYKSSKGAVQFPIDQALPLALIQKMVRFRMEANEEKAQMKKKK